MNKSKITSSEKLEGGCRHDWSERQKRRPEEKQKRRLIWKKRKGSEKLHRRLLLKLKQKQKLGLKRQHA
jgi:hypothetical protein